jgi:glycine cleavage system H protein
MDPENLRYTKEHEWVLVEGDIGTIGITFHAQKELGDIVYVDLPKTGAGIQQGKTIGSVESVKAVSDIFTPVSGEVVEVNPALAESPEILNKDPYGSGWLVKIKLSEPGEAGKLLTVAEYQAYIGTESS